MAMFYLPAIRASKSPVAKLELPRQRTSNSAQPKTARLAAAQAALEEEAAGTAKGAQKGKKK